MSNFFSRFSKPIYFNSIDELPIYNWFKIQEGNEFNYLIKNIDSIDEKNIDVQILADIWHKLYSEFIDYFGVNDIFKAVLDLQKDIAIMKLDMLIEDDKSIQTFIEIKEFELSEITAKQSKSNLSDITYYIEKEMGFSLDEKNTSVKKYYTRLKQIQNERKNKA